MLPDEPIASRPATTQRSARAATADEAALGEEDGITFWRGFDPATLGSQVFLARARAAPGTRIPPHWHSHDTVAFLMDGSAVFRSGADLLDVHEMSPGDWLFVPAGMVHVEETPAGEHGDFLYARDGGGGTTTYVEQGETAAADSD